MIDDGALGDKQYAYDGDEFAPDFDMFIWGWGGDVDPNFILSVLTTSSIESWSDCNWSNAEYDKLFLEQQTTIDLQERIDIVHRMQEIVYDESPYIPLVYPLDLEAANKGKWTGWVRAERRQRRLVVQHPARHLRGRAPRVDRRGRRVRRVQHGAHRRHRGRCRGDRAGGRAAAQAQRRPGRVRGGLSGGPGARVTRQGPGGGTASGALPRQDA